MSFPFQLVIGGQGTMGSFFKGAHGVQTAAERASVLCKVFPAFAGGR
jgi:hypothetical protein